MVWMGGRAPLLLPRVIIKDRDRDRARGSGAGMETLAGSCS